MKKKIIPEDKSRHNLISHAKAIGCEAEVRQIIQTYDRLMKFCSNEQERQHMAYMGLIELHKLLGAGEALVINGQEILPAQPIIDIK